MSIPLLADGLQFALNYYVLRQVEGMQLMWPKRLALEVMDSTDKRLEKTISGFGILRCEEGQTITRPLFDLWAARHHSTVG